MTRLSSNSEYVIIICSPIVGIVIAIFGLTSTPPFTGVIFISIVCFAGSAYLLYTRKRVFYKDGELYVGKLFSDKLNVIRKDRFGSIDPEYRDGNYKITYYDDENNVKYAYFSLDSTALDGKQIIEDLNKID